MKKTADLCTACVAVLKEGYTLARIAGGVDNKITCAHCGRRRYGATYELTAKKAGRGEWLGLFLGARADQLLWMPWGMGGGGGKGGM